jgi:hypothetical protein
MQATTTTGYKTSEYPTTAIDRLIHKALAGDNFTSTKTDIIMSALIASKPRLEEDQGDALGVF